ncbi:hypothetical protein V8C44DRAFT_108759 [Trichoderma aethiopicum]
MDGCLQTASESFCVPNTDWRGRWWPTSEAANTPRSRPLLMTGGYFLTPPPVAATLSPVLRPMTATLPAETTTRARSSGRSFFGFYPSPGPFAPAGRAGSTTRRRLHCASSSRHGFCQPRLLRVGAGGVWVWV